MALRMVKIGNLYKDLPGIESDCGYDMIVMFFFISQPLEALSS